MYFSTFYWLSYVTLLLKRHIAQKKKVTLLSYAAASTIKKHSTILKYHYQYVSVIPLWQQVLVRMIFFLYKMFKATLSAVLNLPIYQAVNI